MIGDIEVGKASDNESSDSGEEEDRSGKFDFGPPLLFSGDSVDLDSLPENIKSRMETITIRRQMVGKLGQFIIKGRCVAKFYYQNSHTRSSRKLSETCSEYENKVKITQQILKKARMEKLEKY